MTYLIAFLETATSDSEITVVCFCELVVFEGLTAFGSRPRPSRSDRELSDMDDLNKSSKIAKSESVLAKSSWGFVHIIGWSLQIPARTFRFNERVRLSCPMTDLAVWSARSYSTSCDCLWSSPSGEPYFQRINIEKSRSRTGGPIGVFFVLLN